MLKFLAYPSFSSACEYFHICNPVPPWDSQDTAVDPHSKNLQLLLLYFVWGFKFLRHIAGWKDVSTMCNLKLRFRLLSHSNLYILKNFERTSIFKAWSSFVLSHNFPNTTTSCLFHYEDCSSLHWDCVQTDGEKMASGDVTSLNVYTCCNYKKYVNFSRVLYLGI